MDRDPLADLLAFAGHELRTPLTSLRLATQMCAEGTLGPLATVQAEVLAGALADCDRLGHLLDHFLDPVLAGDLARLAVRACSAADLAAAAAAEARGAAVERGIGIVCTHQADLPPLRTDPDRLRRALVQLLAHAAAGEPVAGELALAVTASGAATVFTITGTGGATATRATMPLWIGRRLIEALGGECVVGEGIRVAVAG
jgi:NtrC-family two-component system sensor histidine kinase KinB